MFQCEECFDRIYFCFRSGTAICVVVILNISDMHVCCSTSSTMVVGIIDCDYYT